MTTPILTRAALRRTARLGLAGAALLAAVHGASADEGGLGDLLSSIFGARPAAPQAAPVYVPQQYVPSVPRVHRTHLREFARPLTVRLHRAKPRMVADVPTKPGKVSIFEDRTLRRGDAVMTAQGVRVFAGSDAFPYRTTDFVSLKDARSLDRDASKQLAELDKVPRG